MRRSPKYGRLSKSNREQYRDDVNFLYHETSCNVAMIADNLGICEMSVSKLIGPKPERVTTPRPTHYRQRRHPLC